MMRVALWVVVVAGCTPFLPEVPSHKPFDQYGTNADVAADCWNEIRATRRKAAAVRASSNTLTYLGGASGLAGGLLAALSEDDLSGETPPTIEPGKARVAGAWIAFGGAALMLVGKALDVGLLDGEMLDNGISNWYAATSSTDSTVARAAFVRCARLQPPQ